MRIVLTILLGLLFSLPLHAQKQRKEKKKDTLPYFERYKEKITFRVITGINDAPFNLEYRFPHDPIKTMKFQPNPQHVMGIGLNYYGFAVAVHFKLPTMVRSERLYGKSKYFDIEISSQIKKWVIDLSFRQYKNFALSNLPTLDTTYIANTGLDIRKNMKSWTFSSNLKYFFLDQYDFTSAKGFAGSHLKSAWSPYAMGILTGYQVDAVERPFLHSSAYVPSYSFSQVTKLGVFEFGVIPGIAFILARKGFNLHMNMGVGAVVQYQDIHRYEDQLGRWGIGPKIDLGLDIGVNKPNWFLKLFLSYDIKYSDMDALSYFHNYYKILLTGGYRLKVKTPKFLKDGLFKKKKKV